MTDALLRRLEAENDQLRARIDDLEAALGMHIDVPIVLGLTVLEARLMAALISRAQCSKDYLMSAMYSHTADAGRAEIKIVDVVICKVRRKLRPFGIDIKTVWGQGYALTDDSRTQFKALTASHEVRG